MPAGELKRRRVIASVIWYAVAAWVIIQVADVVGPALSLPSLTVRYLVFVAVAGFPIIVVLAWMFDLTPTGVQRTPRRVNPKNLAEGVPRVPEAYELYVRANQIATRTGEWQKAIDVYRECLQRDPSYAPAWARMARCYRLISKFTVDDDESSRHLKLASDPWLDGLRDNTRFKGLLRAAETRHKQARESYIAVSGPSILILPRDE